MDKLVCSNLDFVGQLSYESFSILSTGIWQNNKRVRLSDFLQFCLNSSDSHTLFWFNICLSISTRRYICPAELDGCLVVDTLKQLKCLDTRTTPIFDINLLGRLYGIQENHNLFHPHVLLLWLKYEDIVERWYQKYCPDYIVFHCIT